MIVFIHIPKTGGSSMMNMFMKYMAKTNQQVFSEVIQTKKRWDYFINIKDNNYDYVSCHTDGKCSTPNDLISNISHKDKNINWVTLLRDPMKRVISEYYFLKWGSENEEMQRKIKLLRDVTNRITIPSTLEEYINDTISFNSQVKYLLGKGVWVKDNISDTDVDNLIYKMNELEFKVGITDYMDDTLKYFNNKFKYNMEMLFLNKNNYEGYKDIKLDDNIKDMIKKNNQYDYKLYNYYKTKFRDYINGEEKE